MKYYSAIKIILLFTTPWMILEGMTEDEMAGWHHQLDGHEFG